MFAREGEDKDSGKHLSAGLRMYDVFMAATENSVTFYAIRPDHATIDHASHDGVGEAICPTCGVRYEIYATRIDTARLSRPELSQLAAARISGFQETMGKIEPPNHDEDVHFDTWVMC
jgi:hypothetical protein